MSVDVLTFGCRLNAYEVEVARPRGRAAGRPMIVNTCAVTRSRAPGAPGDPPGAARAAGRAHRRTGCAAQIDPQRFAAMPEVDRGHRQRREAAAGSWRRMRRGCASPTHVGAQPRRISSTGSAAAPAPLSRSRTAAIIAAHSASSRSGAANALGAGRRGGGAGRALVEHGYREVVLTGVDITELWRGSARRAASGSWCADPRDVPDSRACASPRSTPPRSTPICWRLSPRSRG